MLSKHHIEMSIFSHIILFSWLIFLNTVVFLIILCGVFIGCLLPDTDLPRSKIDYMEGIAGFFGIISKNLLNPFVAKIFEYYFKKPIDQSHRGITHTIYGILAYCLLIEGLSLLILFLLGFGPLMLMYSFFVLGLILGGIFHLLEDSCTKMGVFPFYPVNPNKKYSGTISTYDLADARPKYFSSSLLIVAAFLLTLQIAAKFPVWINIFFSICSFLIVWILIIVISRV
jgi:membrane-bound metal-dependent hydrolase YbcI (DUF457 family)